jgi:DNA-binding response OmpR family regulator
MRGAYTVGKQQILVVEKDQILATQMASALEKAGYGVVIASDALEAMDNLLEVRPDLVIIAKELPQVRGEDTFLRVRQASYVPIMVIGGEEEAVETLESGADAYLTTPLDLTLSVARVRALLRRKRQYYPPKSSLGSASGLLASLMKKRDES